MRLRYKFIALYSCIFFIVLTLVGLSLFTQVRLQKLSEAALKGQELLEQSRRVRQLTKDVMIGAFAPDTYSNLKDVLYFDVYTSAVRSWKEASIQFQNQFRTFIEDPTLISLVHEGVLKEEYATAELMSQKAFGKLIGLQMRLQNIQDAGLLGEDLYIRIQRSSNSDLIALFDEARQTSYYLANSFESFLNYFIQALDAEGRKIQRNLVRSFLILGLLGALLAALIPLFFSSRIVRRLKILGNALYTVAEGDFSTPLKFSSHDEFQELATHFNRYTSILKEHLRALVSIAQHISEKTLENSQNDSTNQVLQTVLAAALDLLEVDEAAYFSMNSSVYNLSCIVSKHNNENTVLADPSIIPITPLVEIQKISTEDISSVRFDSTQGTSNSHFLKEKLLLGVLVLYRAQDDFNDLDRIRIENFIEFAALLITNANTYAELVEERSAEYQALQSQVQPHFLYNVLGGFAALNRMGNRDSLERSILALKDMLRYTVSHEAIATIAEELSFIEKYLELQKLRFQDRLIWNIDIEQELKTIRIPKLIIQPLIENAIIHGIEPTGDMGSIKLSITKHPTVSGSYLFIIVEDSGQGFDPQKTQKGIGLANVERRLQLRYPAPDGGSQAQFHIDSKPGEGCRIELYFPLDENNE
ncbi:histidine kinase [Gracilinema caldarium]|uniref:sensor histidine kinase n=1 Tax=Gracilinema caldarium TaxID=215591 RepID=UPI0026EB325A|nr:histidine kinase [Gracilinema caldarium]